jgi:hypothetical protein
MQNKTLHVTCIAHKHWDIYLTFTVSCKLDLLNGLAFVPRDLYVPECERINAISAEKLTVKLGDNRQEYWKCFAFSEMENSNKDDGHLNSTRSDGVLNAMVLIFLKNSYNYRRITSVKFPSFWMTIFSVSGTKFMVLLRQSHDCSYHVSRRRRILAPPPLWLQKHPELFAQEFAYCPYLWHQPSLINFTCVWSKRVCEINPAIHGLMFVRSNWQN